MSNYIVESGEVILNIESTDSRSAAINFLRSHKSKKIGKIVSVTGKDIIYFSVESLLKETKLKVV